MNLKPVSLLVTIIATTLMANDAFAQRQGRPPMPPGQSGQATDDADGARRGPPPRGQQQNGRQQNGRQQNNGSSSSQGLDASQVASRMMQNFDADGDGALNAQELLAGLTALQQSMQQRQRGQGRAQPGNPSGDQTQALGRNSSQSGQSRGPRGGGQQNGRQRRGR